MENATIHFFDGDIVRSESVPVHHLPKLSACRTFWRGDAFTDKDREAMTREGVRRKLLLNGKI